jgi:hypothetical protein
MVNFKKLSDQAKNLVEKRGGMDSLKEDAAELKDIAKGKGSLSDKAKAAAAALKDPGEKGEQPKAEGEAAGGEATQPAGEPKQGA